MITSFIFFLLSMAIGLGFFILHIAISIWVYRDAIRKGNSKEYAIVVLAANLIFPIAGLIIYLIIRHD